MTPPDEESQWRRAYEASIADQEARSLEAASGMDPVLRRAFELRARFLIVIWLFLFAGLGLGLLLVGPWYVSIVGVMLLLGAVLTTVGAAMERPWRIR